MKVEVREKDKPRKYPYLGIAQDGDIVLFIRESTGLVINDRFYYSEAWVEQAFRPYSGEVVLSND